MIFWGRTDWAGEGEQELRHPYDEQPRNEVFAENGPNGRGIGPGVKNFPAGSLFRPTLFSKYDERIGDGSYLFLFLSLSYLVAECYSQEQRIGQA